MRWLMTVVGCAVLCQSATAQDAQKLYNAMEQKLTKAKSFRFAYTIDLMEGGEPHFKYQGSMTVAAGNRFLLLMHGSKSGQTHQIVLVSDGKIRAGKHTTDGQSLDLGQVAVHEKLNDALSGWFTRAGMFECLGRVLQPAGQPEGVVTVKLSDFKMAGKAKVGILETHVIEFQLAKQGMKGKGKLWLDTETGLPLRRVVEGDIGTKNEWRLVETYTQWELEPKNLPDSTFTLPK